MCLAIHTEILEHSRGFSENFRVKLLSPLMKNIQFNEYIVMKIFAVSPEITGELCFEKICIFLK